MGTEELLRDTARIKTGDYWILSAAPLERHRKANQTYGKTIAIFESPSPHLLHHEGFWPCFCETFVVLEVLLDSLICVTHVGWYSLLTGKGSQGILGVNGSSSSLKVSDPGAMVFMERFSDYYSRRVSWGHLTCNRPADIWISNQQKPSIDHKFDAMQSWNWRHWIAFRPKGSHPELLCQVQGSRPVSQSGAGSMHTPTRRTFFPLYLPAMRVHQDFLSDTLSILH